MAGNSLKAIGLTVGFCAILGACIPPFGPKEISIGRQSYNNVIHNTALTQVFANVVRVYFHEPMLFMDVSEVDAAFTFQGSTGNTGVSNLNGKMAESITGAIGVGLEYQESPTIRYVPLLGAAQIAQISTPMTVDSLANLLNSDWPVHNVLLFAADRLTPAFSDYYQALDTFAALDNKGALVYAPVKSSLTTAPSPQGSNNGNQGGGIGGAQGGAAQSQPNDTLAVFIEPGDDPSQQVKDWWLKLVKIYCPTQPWSKRDCAKITPLKRLPHRIELRTAPVAPAPVEVVSACTASLRSSGADAATRSGAVVTPPPGPVATAPPGAVVAPPPNPVVAPLSSGAAGMSSETCSVDKKHRKETTTSIKWATKVADEAPVLRMRSGLGILQAAFQAPSFIKIVTKQYEKDVFHDHFVKTMPEILQPGSPEYYEVGDDGYLKTIVAVRSPQNEKMHQSSSKVLKPDRKLVKPLIMAEKSNGPTQYYIIIFDSDSQPPIESYVSYQDETNRRWYYIDKDDYVSRRNLGMLAQFLTMQSQATTAPLTPTIGVGGSH